MKTKLNKKFFIFSSPFQNKGFVLIVSKLSTNIYAKYGFVHGHSLHQVIVIVTLYADS